MTSFDSTVGKKSNFYFFGGRKDEVVDKAKKNTSKNKNDFSNVTIAACFCAVENFSKGVRGIGAWKVELNGMENVGIDKVTAIVGERLNTLMETGDCTQERINDAMAYLRLIKDKADNNIVLNKKYKLRKFNTTRNVLFRWKKGPKRSSAINKLRKVVYRASATVKEQFKFDAPSWFKKMGKNDLSRQSIGDFANALQFKSKSSFFGALKVKIAGKSEVGVDTISNLVTKKLSTLIAGKNCTAKDLKDAERYLALVKKKRSWFKKLFSDSTAQKTLVRAIAIARVYLGRQKCAAFQDPNGKKFLSRLQKMGNASDYSTRDSLIAEFLTRHENRMNGQLKMEHKHLKIKRFCSHVRDKALNANEVPKKYRKQWGGLGKDWTKQLNKEWVEHFNDSRHFIYTYVFHVVKLYFPGSYTPYAF